MVRLVSAQYAQVWNNKTRSANYVLWHATISNKNEKSQPGSPSILNWILLYSEVSDLDNVFPSLYFSAPKGSDICPTREIKINPDSPETMKGALYSPNFPNFYPNDQSCTLTLDVPDNYKAVVTFQKFALQCKNNSCFVISMLKTLQRVFFLKKT